MDRNITILVIEDGDDDVALLRMALKREGINHPIQVVGDGKDAVDYLQGINIYEDRSKFPFPSVIFSDIKMPRMSGFEILEWLRHHAECSVIPFIILSASKQDADIKRAYQMGANAYLVKPSRLEDLQSMVRTAFEFWFWCEKPHVSGKC